MENNKNNNIWIWVGVVVIVALIVWVTVNKKDDVEEVNDIDGTEQELTEEGVPPRNDVAGVEDRSEGSVNVGTPVPTLSYTDALTKYKDYRIQIDGNCQAFPNNVTFKNGASIMIDNRSPLDRTIKVGSQYPIKAWGFKIVKLNSNTLPATWLVDCTQGARVTQNVATILIQK